MTPCAVLGLWAEEEFGEFDRRGRSDVLGEVCASGDEDSRDLRPLGAHRVSGTHEIETAVGVWQIGSISLDDCDSARGKSPAGMDEVGWERLGGGHARRQYGCFVEEFSATGVDVEGSSRGGQTLREELSIAPRWAFFRGAVAEPVEAPAGDVGRLRLSEKFLE